MASGLAMPIGFDCLGEDQADLRATNTSLRLAINAARRDPRAHGIAVSFLAAVATMPLMKRVLVFMTASSVWCLLWVIALA